MDNEKLSQLAENILAMEESDTYILNEEIEKIVEPDSYHSRQLSNYHRGSHHLPANYLQSVDASRYFFNRIIGANVPFSLSSSGGAAPLFQATLTEHENLSVTCSHEARARTLLVIMYLIQKHDD